MIAVNPTHRFLSDGSEPALPVSWPAERGRHYFEGHPELVRADLFLDAGRTGIDFHEQTETGNGVGPTQPNAVGNHRSSTVRPSLSAEDLRIHAWLTERVTALHYERHGLWPKFRRLLFGNRLMRSLGLAPQRPGDER